MNKIKILIVDDHEIIHRGLKDLLQTEAGYQIAGHAYDGKEAIEQAHQLKPEIIFLDISMPGMSGIDAAKTISIEVPGSRIIMLTQHDEAEYAKQALKAGASGYILKNTSKDQLIRAMQTVLSNKRFLNEEISEKLLNDTLATQENQSHSEIYLTKREKEILVLIAEDYGNHQIAEKLFVSLRTVETHRRNIMQKFKVNTVVGLLKVAAKLQLISLK